MKGEQMDLLAFRPPAAIVYSFPLHREAARVRDVAKQINRRTGALAAKYWRTECNRLYGMLHARGLPKEAIEIEVERFSGAVRCELYRMAPAHCADHGGDAA